MADLADNKLALAAKFGLDPTKEFSFYASAIDFLADHAAADGSTVRAETGKPED